MSHAVSWRQARGLPQWEPATVLLQLADIRQTSPHDCGPTAFRIVCDYFSIAPPAPASCDLTGLPPDYLESHLRRAGLRVQFGEMTVEDLRHHTEQNRPVICLVNVGGEGHYVVSRGVSRNRVYVQCPLKGRVDYSRRAFVSAWRDVSRLGGEYSQFGIAAGRKRSAEGKTAE